MNPVVPAVESLASRFNGLGLWRTEHAVWGHRMRARTFDRSLYLWMHGRGFMGEDERRLLCSLVRPGMTALDIGANLGLYSLKMASLVGASGRVIAFEPDPDLYALLAENCASNGAANVEARNLAVGSGPDRMVLHRLTLNSGDNHLGQGGRAAFRRPVEVEVASIDALYPALRPDFVKIDVQGWELKVLRGMETVLRASEAVGVYLEIWPDGLRRAGDSPEALFAFVREVGLRFYSCVDGRELDRADFTEVARTVRGLTHVDLFASRRPPNLLGEFRSDGSRQT